MQLVTLAAALVIASFSMVAIAIEFEDDGDDEESLQAGVVETPGPDEPTPTPFADRTPDADATPLPSAASSVARILIPVAVVETDNIIDLALAPDGSLAVPTDPASIAYYQFSGSPSERNSGVVIGGLAVRTAEVEGVLANVAALAPGDQVVLELADGSSASYRVFAATSLPIGTVLPEAVGCTATECDPRGTLTIVGFQAGGGNIVIQAQRA